MLFEFLKIKENYIILLEKSLNALNPDNILSNGRIEDWEDFKYNLSSVYELDYKRTMVRFDKNSSEDWKKYAINEYDKLLDKHLNILLEFWKKVFAWWNLIHIDMYKFTLFGNEDMGEDESKIFYVIENINNDIENNLNEYGWVYNLITGKPNLINDIKNKMAIFYDYMRKLENIVFYSMSNVYLVEEEFISSGYYDIEAELDGIADFSKEVVNKYWFNDIIKNATQLMKSIKNFEHEYYNKLEMVRDKIEEIYENGYGNDELIAAIESEEIDISIENAEILIQIANELGVEVNELYDHLNQIEYLILDEEQGSGNINEEPILYRLNKLINEFESIEIGGWTNRLLDVGTSKEQMGEKINTYADYMDEIDKLLKSGNTNEKLIKANFYKQTVHFTGSMLEYVDNLLGVYPSKPENKSEIDTDSWKLFTQLSGHTYEELMNNFEGDTDAEKRLNSMYNKIYDGQIKTLSRWNQDLKNDGISIPREYLTIEMDRIKKGNNVPIMLR